MISQRQATTYSPVTCIMLAALLLLTFGCSSGSDRAYKLAVEDGERNIPYVREMATLFPGAKSFISYYTGVISTPTWNTEVGIYGRYILTMQSKIAFNADGTSIKTFDDPAFYLVEVEKFTTLPDGIIQVSYTDVQVKFGKKEWKAVVDSHGDLSVLGISPIKDRPIPDFDKQWSKN